jgi:nucleoid-associated protein YgaU
MGNFEKLSVLVIVVIIVMILVVALHTWTDGTPEATETTIASSPSLDPVRDLIDPRPPEPQPQTPLVVPPAPPPAPPPTPPPAPVPPAPTPEERPVARDHVVASGETLEKISKKHYGTTRHVAAIERANPGVDAMRLRIGQRLVIPEVSGAAFAPGSSSPSEGSSGGSRGSGGATPGETYTVRRGDSLPAIAKRAYGKIDRWHEIWLSNYERIDDPDRLKAGTRLQLPK